MIRYIFDDRVVTNFSFSFYGFKVESSADNFMTIPADFFETLSKKARSSNSYDNILFVCFKRSKVKDYPDDFKTAYKTDVYFITSSYELFLMLSEIKTLTPLSGEELAGAIFSLHALTEDYAMNGRFLKEKTSPFSKSTILLPPVSRTYQSFFQNVVELKKKQGRYPFFIYKGIRMIKKPDLSTLFEVPWTGSLYIRINLNNIYSILKSRASLLNSADRRFWKEFAERYKVGEENVVLTEATFITDEQFEEKIISTIFSSLGMEYLQWAKFYEKIIRETPLKLADSDFESVIELERAASFCVVSFAKNSRVETSDTFFGTNRNGEIVFYSPFQEGQSPHMLIIAPTRSGKSFFVQNLTTMIANVDLHALWTGRDLNRKLPVWVRYFDVGFSAEFWITLMKKRGFDAEILSPQPDIKINIFEIDDYNDVEIAVKLASLILESKGVQPFTAVEEGYLRTVLKKFIDKSSLPPKHVIRLKEEVPWAYEEARKLGYSDSDDIHSFKEKHLKQFTYPTVSDVIRELNILELEKRETEPEAAKIIAETVFKLKNIKAIDNFSSYSDRAFSNVRFLYIDLSFMKGSKNFIAIYASLLTKIVKQITSVNPHDIKFFVCDEFHNIIKIKMFKEFYDVLVREAAKYNLYLVMISQNPEDVPFDIANNIATKIFLKPADKKVLEDNKPSENFEDAVRKTFKISSESALRELKKLPKYTAFVMYPSGFFSIALPVDKIKLKLFESRTITEIETPDGIRIKKSYVGD